jgi:hypothetical protein
MDCSKGEEQKITTELESAVEEREDNMDFVDLCKELESDNRWRLTREDCSGKIDGSLQHNIWKLGGEPATVAGQQQQQQQGRGVDEEL